MNTHEDGSSSRTNTTQLACVMGWLVGAGLLGLALIPTQAWLDWFLHPLNTLDGIPREELIAGVSLLRIMLPIAGLGWIAWTLHLQSHQQQAGPTRKSAGFSGRWMLAGAVLLMAGTALRLPLLEDSLWYDEIASFWYYGQFGPGPIIGNMFTPANHTLQTLSSWTSVVASGGSLEPAIIRLPALILGLATIWPMSMLARDTFQSRPFLLLSIALLLLCPIAILESTEARGYAFMLFFGTGGSALLLRYLLTGQAALLSFYAVVTTLGIWSHLVTVVVPMGHAAFLIGAIVLTRGNVTTTRSRAWCGLFALTLAGITTLTALSPVLPDLLSDSETFSANRSDQPDLLGREGINGLLGLGGAWSLLGGLTGLLLVCTGCMAAVRDKSLRGPLLVTGLPLVVALVLVSGLGTWVYARFLVFGLTFTILGIAAGLHLLWSSSRLLASLATALLLIGWGGDLLTRYQMPRQPIREIMSGIPSDGREIGFIGITDLGIILSWYADDPNRVVELPQTDAAEMTSQMPPGIGWIVIAYPSRTMPEIDLDALRRDLSTSGSETSRTLVESFEVRDLKQGWIDDDGTVLLLERTGDAL